MPNPLVRIGTGQASLQGAPTTIGYLRDTVVPNPVAYTGRDVCTPWRAGMPGRAGTP